MTPTNTYLATCWREGAAWVVHIPEIDRVTSTARLSQVEGAAHDMVTQSGAADAATARVIVDLLVDDDLAQLLDAATAVRGERDRVSVEAVTLRRGLARRLVAEGFAVRDVAALLGVSVVRAQSLIGPATHRPHPRAAGGRLQVPPTRHAGVDHRSRWREDATAAETAQAPVSLTPPRAHQSYRHEALVYRGDADFLASTVPFVLEGVALGQPVMVAVPPVRLDKLRAALGPTPGVHYVDMAVLGANPARIIPAWAAFVDEFGGREDPVRGIGEPVWAGRRPSETTECQLHESLLNLAVEPDMPLWLLCPYDAGSLSHTVIEEASRSHPSLRHGSTYRGSVSYGGVTHVSTLFGAPLSPPPVGTVGLTFSGDDLVSVRRAVGRHPSTAPLGEGRARELAQAVSEVALNSIRYGGGSGTLRMWRGDGAVVCEVSDLGRITDPLVGRHPPAPSAPAGRGLWMANQLCDLVQIRSGPDGTTVRLLCWL